MAQIMDAGLILTIQLHSLSVSSLCISTYSSILFNLGTETIYTRAK